MAAGTGPRAAVAMLISQLCLLSDGGSSGDDGADCQRLCDFDTARTNQCHVGRLYTQRLVSAFDAGAWGSIFAQSLACSDDCAAPECEQELDGKSCTASRSWVARRLAMPEDLGGGGLSDRCGLLGQMLSAGAVCLNETDDLACDSMPGCLWDESRGVCDASHEKLLSTASTTQRQELLRVAVRRQQCGSIPSESDCHGDCMWQGDQCRLNPFDALLTVVGEGCPLHVVLQQNMGCRTENQTLCTHSNDRCVWRDGFFGGQCEAHPLALERDLLGILGLDYPSLVQQWSAAQVSCSSLSSEDCSSMCAPEISIPRSASCPAASSVTVALAAILARIWSD